MKPVADRFAPEGRTSLNQHSREDTAVRKAGEGAEERSDDELL